jgi:histidine triad (HIT) family protein
MDCVFCQIIRQEIPTKIIYQDDLVLAFDDLHPRAPQHKLIIPRKHIATLNDLQEEDTLLAGHLLQTTRHLAKELKIADSGYRVVLNCNAGAGQAVFHIHLHLLGGRPMTWPPG